MATSGWRGCIYRSEGIWWQNHTDIHRWEKNEQGVGAGVAIFSGNELVTKLKYKLGTTAVFELQSLPPSLTNTSVVAVRTSSFRLSVFRFHSVFSCLRLFPTHNASRILFATCSYSGKVVHHASCLPLAVTMGKWSYVQRGGLVSKSKNISFSSVIISAKNGG